MSTSGRPSQPGGNPAVDDRSAPVFDLFADLFGGSKAAQAMTARGGRDAGESIESAPALAPRSPATLKAAGLSPSFLAELTLKELYLRGTLSGGDIARSLRLPFPIIDEGLRDLKDRRCIEVSQGDLMGRVSYRFALTEMGRARAREIFESCRYVGPAPVPLEQYVEQCKRQGVTGVSCNPTSLLRAFTGLLIRPGLLEEVGPAVCSGRSIFLFGPPGNGKTVVAKGLGAFLNLYGGDIYVPYAISAESSIVTLYDPVVHHATDETEVAAYLNPGHQLPGERNSVISGEGPIDMRWRRIRRPVVIVGGELTLEMLELQYSTTGQFYAAPLHLKANGGVFLIDDFGRQLVRPKDLLNRWIVPLEERQDYLSMVTGRKFSAPFEQLIIFSTNLDPKDLVDDAFLRRIRHKIKIDTPPRTHYTEIFKLVCGQRGYEYRESVVDVLYRKYYDCERLPRCSDPRDLLEIAGSICRFNDEQFELTEELILDAAHRFFSGL